MPTAKQALDPQSVDEVIAAIVALDWSSDPVGRPVDIIIQKFGFNIDQAREELESLHEKRRIVLQHERAANNIAETGITAAPIRSRWVLPGTYDETASLV